MTDVLYDRVQARVAQLDRLIKAHAGGLVLEGVARDGTVRVRFTGMCAGCENRPVTTIGSVRPALMAIEGVARVEIVGTRISEEAEQRIAMDLRDYTPRQNILRALDAIETADRLASHVTAAAERVDA